MFFQTGARSLLILLNKINMEKNNCSFRAIFNIDKDVFNFPLSNSLHYTAYQLGQSLFHNRLKFVAQLLKI